MNKLKVFYDGECHLCHREIKFYIKLDKEKNLIPIDIKAKDFDATKHNLDPELVDIHIHVIDEKGKVFTKLDAFIEIWKRVPYHSLLSKFMGLPGVHFCVDKLYILFAEKIRPRLPKRNCEDGNCKI